MIRAPGRTLRAQVLDLVVHLVRGDGSEQFNPAGAMRLARGDRVTVQATLSAYQDLRARMGRAA